MKTLLLATHAKFWLENRGGRVRICNIYRYLKSIGFVVPVFFSGELDNQDLDVFKEKFSDLQLFTLANGHQLENLNWNSLAKNTFSPGSELSIGRVGYQINKQVSRGVERIRKKLILSYLRHYKKRRVVAFLEPSLQDFYSKDHLEYFKSICDKVQPDFLLVELIRLAYLFQGARNLLPDHTSALIDTHDVMYQRCQRFHEFGEKHWINIKEDEEAHALEQFDVIIAITERDAAEFRKMLPHKHVITAGHSSNIVSYEPCYKSWVSLAYIASKGSHNKRAIINFLRSVWPLLRAEFDDRIRLYIAGTICNTLDVSDVPDGVRLLGFVEDLDSVFQDIDIVINPVYFGGGLKIKNVDALCRGKPLVTTVVGAEGLEKGIGDAFYVCDTPGETYEKLAMLIKDPGLRNYLSKSALRFAKNNFSEESAYREFSKLLLA